MATRTTSNVAKAVAPQLTLVKIQTMRGTQGHAAAFAEVEKAVKAHNAANPKAPAHIARMDTAIAANTKGMQWRLATLATLARQHGATMIRLGVHNGEVALCGTPASVKAVQDAMVPTCNALGTLVANTYNADAHGNRVGFTNAFLCGCPAGLQIAAGIVSALAYGIGFLFEFPAPGSGMAYAMGTNAARTMAKPTTKPSTPKAPKAPKVVTTPTPNAELDLLNAQERERDATQATA